MLTMTGILAIVLLVFVLVKLERVERELKQLRNLFAQRDSRPPAGPVPPPKPEPQRTTSALADRLRKAPEPAAAPPRTPKPVPVPIPPPRPAPQPTPIAPPPPRPAPQPAPARTAGSPSDDFARWWAGFERRIGQQWLVWVGVLVLLIGVGFFVKLAFERRWINEQARVLMGAGLGIGMLILGGHFIRKKFSALGQGISGGGIGILYVSLYAAMARYELVSQRVGFGLMALVVALGMVSALRNSAVSISILATLGGFLTPLLIGSTEMNRDALFGYLLLIDLGVLGVAFFRRWKALDALAFAGTVALYVQWGMRFYTEDQLGPMLGWLAAFYTVFLVLPFLNHLLRGEAAPISRFVMAILNALAGFVLAYVMLYAHHRPALAWIAAGMGACYAAMGVLTRARVPADRKQVFGFLAMAVGFLTIAVPLRFEVNGIVLAWAVEAPLLLFIAYRYRYLPLRVFAFAVLGLLGLYAACATWPTYEDAFRLFLNRPFLTAMCAPLSMAAFWMCHAFERNKSRTDRLFGMLALWAAGLAVLALAYAQFHIWYGFEMRDPVHYMRLGTLTLLVAAWATAYLAAGVLRRRRLPTVTGLVLLVGAAVPALVLTQIAPPRQMAPVFNLRFAALMACALAAFGASWLFRAFAHRGQGQSGKQISVVLNAMAVLALLVVLSFEAYTGSRIFGAERGDPGMARRMALMSLSLVWGVFATTLLIVGIVKRFSPYRYAALALLMVTTIKLLTVDIATLDEIYRVIAFIVMGFLLIGGSYLYYRLEQMLAGAPKGDAGDREGD